MKRSPLIGVSGRQFDPGRLFKLEAATAIQTEYLDAVRNSGGIGVILTPELLTDARADELVGRLDGIVFTGGPDVDPSRYGESPHPETYGISDLQDSFEASLLCAAQRTGRPLLAICRGAQLVNVLCGGSLDQHITGREGVLAHGIPNGGGGSDNIFLTEPASRLAHILGESAEGRCHHHQAVATVGEGLRVSARTSDGIIEGLEYADAAPAHWMIAVQWHPEESAATDGRLFDALIAEARSA